MAMSAAKANIIAQLQKDILPLQGFKPIPNGEAIDVGLGQIKYAFPNALFPLGAVHEFCCAGTEDSAATCGFIAGILAPLMRSGGVSLWISSSRTLFPTALKEFGIEPDKIVFVDLKKQKDVLWATEEALKCGGLSAVVGEISEISFTASRRLQLAVEQSRVTGFILRINPRDLNTTACVSRWKISPLPSGLPDDMPGIGFPRWNVELLKVRNGKPGNWQIEWKAGRFRHGSRLTSIPRELQKKTG
jgi:protein ImuA